MSDADIGNDRKVGPGEPRERGDLSRVVHADLPNCGVVRDGRRKNRKGETNVIIEVALRFHHTVAHRQNSGGELLGARFPAASGDARDLEGETVAPCRRQPVQRSK